MKQSVTESGDVRRIDTGQVEILLHSGRLDTCRQEMESFLEEIQFRALESLMLRLYVCMDIYIVSRTFSRELGVTNAEFVRNFGSIDDISKQLQTIDGTTEFLHSMVEQCIRWRMETVAENSNDVIRKAKAYIDLHYMDGDLSLRAVAEAVGLSPSYFSAAFKREMKENFSDYLTKVRIRRAKELLCCTTKLIYEIAYDVGFRDYRYFSQIFKKQTGQTPRQFQNSTNSV